MSLHRNTLSDLQAIVNNDSEVRIIGRNQKPERMTCNHEIGYCRADCERDRVNLETRFKSRK
jgi:hypothetical protein